MVQKEPMVKLNVAAHIGPSENIPPMMAAAITM
jgi:hypothetical protein